MTEVICTVCQLAVLPTDTLTVAGKVVCGDCLYEAKLPRESVNVGFLTPDGEILTTDGKILTTDGELL